MSGWDRKLTELKYGLKEKMYVKLRSTLEFKGYAWFEGEKYKVRMSRRTGMIDRLWIKNGTYFNLIHQLGFAYNEYYDVMSGTYFNQNYAKTRVVVDKDKIVASGIVRNKKWVEGKLLFVNQYFFESDMFKIRINREFLSDLEVRDDSVCFIFTRKPDWIKKYSMRIDDKIVASQCERIAKEWREGEVEPVWAEMSGDTEGVRIMVEYASPGLNEAEFRCCNPYPTYKEIEFSWGNGNVEKGRREELFVSVFPLTF